MVETLTFKLNLPGYAIRGLKPEDAPLLQALYDQCADYSLLVEGEPVSPTTAQEEFRSVPEGKSLENKLVCGIFSPDGEIVGVLDALQDYPKKAAWWVGLLLLAPEVRGKGIGRDVIRSFCEFVRLQDGRAIMLGVVEENKPALQFWQEMEFSVLRQTEPRPFGKKMQAVYIMRRQIVRKASQ